MDFKILFQLWLVATLLDSAYLNTNIQVLSGLVVYCKIKKKFFLTYILVSASLAVIIALTSLTFLRFGIVFVKLFLIEVFY